MMQDECEDVGDVDVDAQVTTRKEETIYQEGAHWQADISLGHIA